MIVLGSSEGLHKFARGFYQVFAGAVFPRAIGSNLIAATYESFRARSFLTSVAVLATKWAALNLLPFPILNGGDIAIALTGWITPLPGKLRERLNLVGFLLFLPVLGGWVVALGFFLKSFFA